MSVGPQGAKVSMGPRGTELHLGIPGSGLSHRSRIGGGGGAIEVGTLVILVMIPYSLLFMLIFHEMIYVLLLTPIGHALWFLEPIYTPMGEHWAITLAAVSTALFFVIKRWGAGIQERGICSRSEFRQLVNIYREDHPEQKLSFRQARAQMKREAEESLSKALEEWEKGNIYNLD